MQTSFQTKQLTVAVTLAMSAIGLTACGGGSSGGSNGGGNVPIIKQPDAFVGGAESLSQHAFANTTHELPKLSKNSLPLKYKYRENSKEFCTLSADGYSVKLLPNTENKINQCNLWVDNQGGNARFKGISSAYVIDIYPVCEDGQKNGDQSHLCIPAATSIDPVSTAYITDINSPLKINLTGYNLKGNLDNLTIKTDACSDIKHSKKVSTDYTDKDSFTISCTPDTAGTFDLSITNGQDNTTLFTAKINAKLPTIVTNDQLPVLKTGVTTCATNDKAEVACTKESLGDWFGLNQDGEVKAGKDFSYSKKIHQNPTTHKTEICIYDNVTGLLWEAKTDDGGLHDKNWMYSWYNTNSTQNGGYSGAVGSDTCGGNKTIGTECNSQTYIAKLNEIKYCGYDDWRVPYADELISLIDYGHNKPPLINQQYFPLDKDKQYIYLSATSDKVGSEFYYIPISTGWLKKFDKSYGAPLHLRAVRAD